MLKLHKLLLLNPRELKQVQGYRFDNFHPNAIYISVSVGIYAFRESTGKVIANSSPSLKRGASLARRL
jgi:hypothetical protein